MLAWKKIIYLIYDNHSSHDCKGTYADQDQSEGSNPGLQLDTEAALFRMHLDLVKLVKGLISGSERNRASFFLIFVFSTRRRNWSSFAKISAENNEIASPRVSGTKHWNFGNFFGAQLVINGLFCKSTFPEIRMKELMLYLGNTFAITMA